VGQGRICGFRISAILELGLQYVWIEGREREGSEMKGNEHLFPFFGNIK